MQTRVSQFRIDIQGLRAIAVVLVLLYHAGVPLVGGGYIGVDVFFVISGFLITSHLLRSLESDGRIGFASFYARRARRILPASLTVLLLTIVAAFIFMPPLQLKALLQSAIATAVYLPNYYFAYIGTSYLSEKTPSLFQHYWSLGIEEQFYLVWPALLALGFLAFRRSRRSLFLFVTGLTLVSFVAGAVWTSVDQPWAFFSLPTRAWELGAGGLVAFALGSRFATGGAGGGVDAGQRWFEHPLFGIAGWVGLAGLFASALFFTDQTSFPSWNAALPVASTALVIIGSVGRRLSPQRVLSIRPLVFIGGISYSLYLVHWPVLLVTQAAVGERDVLPLWANVALMVACVPLAWVLYRFVETPFRNPPRLANARRRSLLLAGASSVVVVALCAVGIVVAGKLPLSEDRDAPLYAATVQPVGTTFVPANLDPSLADAKDSVPATSSNGCHLDFAETSSAGCQIGEASAPTVTLFGDSHAEQWYPPLQKLADEGLIRVDSNTKSSCNSADVVSLLNNEPYPVCDRWRHDVIARLNANPPAVIVLANYARKNDVQSGGLDFATYWQNSLEATIRQLPKQSKVVIIGETPTMGVTAAICLSSHLGDADYCGLPPSEAIDRASLDAEARVASATGARLLDMNPYLCDASWCPPIIDNVLVYSDDHHLTVPFTTALSGVVGDAIGQAMGGAAAASN